MTPFQHSGTGNLDEIGWYKDNSGRTTHPVGEKLPNDFGLHDMHGNIQEWCEDIYDGQYSKSKTAVKDPVCTSGSEGRVARGGSFRYGDTACRSASRSGIFPPARSNQFGFRPTWSLP